MIDENEITLTPIRCGGPGGQNVNKVSSGIELRFDIHASTLSPTHKERLLSRRDHRINETGVVVIQACTYRTQSENRAEAIARLEVLIEATRKPPKKRIKTKPSKAAKRRRLEDKKKRSVIKKNRQNRPED
jgi:ribosome-associated protein